MFTMNPRDKEKDSKLKSENDSRPELLTIISEIGFGGSMFRLKKSIFLSSLFFSVYIFFTIFMIIHIAWS